MHIQIPMNPNTQIKTVESGDFAALAIQIRPINNSRELFDIYRMTYECYQSHTKPESHPDGLWIPHPEFDHIPETTILIAEMEGRIVGSVSLTRDSNNGLPMAQSCDRTCALVRANHRNLAGVWRLLVRPGEATKEAIALSLLSDLKKRLLDEHIQTCLLSVSADYIDLCGPLLHPVMLFQGQMARGLSNLPGVFLRCDVENFSEQHSPVKLSVKTPGSAPQQERHKKQGKTGARA